MVKFYLCLVVLLGACTTDQTPQVLPRIIQPGDALTMKWNIETNDACPTCVPKSCGHVVSHPCPYLLFTTVLSITGNQTVFGSATGGSDVNGIPAENHVQWMDDFVLDGESLVLPERGDDGGLRHATELYPSAGNYEGDITWTLFNIPGNTTFHVDLTFEQPAQ